LINPVHAVEFLSYKIVAQVEDNQVTEDLVIVLFNNREGDLKSGSISVPKDFEIISVSDSYGELKYTTSPERGILIEFFFTRPIKPGEDRVIIIKLRSGTLITAKEGYSEYLFVFTPKTDIPDFEHVLKLPSDAELYSPHESFPLVVPEANLTYADGIPTLTWKKGLWANQPAVFLARYRAGYPRLWSRLSKVALALAGLAFLGFTGYKLQSRYKRMRALASLKILNERERRVLEAVIKKEGLRQYELRADLGYTKASLSKILTKLESRGLIRKKKVGKINKLYIGEKLR
jgi:hypothetical protein